MGDLFVFRSSWSMFWTNFWCVLLSSSCIISSVLVTFTESRNHQMNNFVSVNYLPDGEIETRIHYNGISAKETSVSNRNNSGLMYRELTDGRRFIQLVYENGTLKDCDYGRRRDQIQSFLNVFNREDKNVQNLTVSTSSLVIEKLGNSKPLPKNLRRWFNYPKLRKLCRKKKQLRRKKKKVKKQEEANRSLELDFDRVQGKENQQKKSVFVMPGTLWCGDHDVAPTYNSLGTFADTDRCCRRHDFCRKNIQAFSRKYELLNRNPFTISHCYCDASFRACLKIVGTTDANIVGSIFFNWVQTKCFVIKRKKVCAEWEGKKCVKKEIVKRAVLKQNLPY